MRTAIGVVFLGKQPFHHHLGGDAGVIHTRLPQHVLAAHAFETHQDVLERVVQSMAHVQGARDVGRGNHDREGRRAGPRAAPEGTAIFPQLIEPPFYCCRVECLFEHGL